MAAALAAEAAERGFRMLDAPVSGGEQGAIEGVLSIMVGGAAADFEAAAPVFDAVGKTIVHVGPSGSGQTVKAANQLMVAGHLELLAEAIVFLEAYGVDTEAALRVLGGGLAGSTVIQRKGAAMLARDFTPGFRIALHDKDMGIVTAAAREAGVVIPLGAVAAQLVSSLKAQGDGGLDHSALLKLVAQLSGRQRVETEDHATDDYRRRRGRDLAPRGDHERVRAARRGHQPLLRRDAPRRRDHAHAGPARRGRLAHGRGLHAGPRGQHRRVRRAPPGRPAPTC